MRRFELSDDQWRRVEGLLPGQPGSPGRSAGNNRLFLEAVLWIVRTGAPWRDLPERFGDWNSVFQRFNRWAKKGVWQQVFDALQDPDLEWVMLALLTVSGVLLLLARRIVGAQRDKDELRYPYLDNHRLPCLLCLNVRARRRTRSGRRHRLTQNDRLRSEHRRQIVHHPPRGGIVWFSFGGRCFQRPSGANRDLGDRDRRR